MRHDQIRTTLIVLLAVFSLWAALAAPAGATLPRNTVRASERSRAAHPLYGYELQKYVVAECRKLHLDAAAALSVACVEGGFAGAVGDGGSALGPWQCHYLPHQTRAWANSPNGIKWVLRGFACFDRNRRGYQAVYLIVVKFERPAMGASEAGIAYRYYPSMGRLVKKIERKH